MDALSWLIVETLKTVPTLLFGRLVRCSWAFFCETTVYKHIDNFPFSPQVWGEHERAPTSSS